MSDHQQNYPFCRVSFWKDNTAAKADEDWTVCNVAPLGMYTLGEQSFENSNQGIQARDNLLRFLEKAYASGRADAKKEIRDVLGVKDPRP